MAALSVNVIVPEEPLVSTGVNVNCTPHVFPGAICPQLCEAVTTESEEATDEICRVAFPQFVTVSVSVCGLFTSVIGKLTVEGERQTEGEGVPRSNLLTKVC